MIKIHGGIIHTAVNREVFRGDILIDEGKIREHIFEEAEHVIDAEGLDIYPGFIDAYCHVGLDVLGGGPAGMDFNETNDPVAMKCAFGENPKKFYQSKGISSRMTNAAVIRNALKKAQIYLKKLETAEGDSSKYPAYDQKMEALLPVLRREISLKAHAHQANNIFTALS